MGQRFPISFLEDRVKLRNDELVLSRSMAPIYLFCRCNTEHGALTWAGKYSPLPTDYADREGSYFGVGIWFLESILPATDLTALVENIDQTLRELMRNSNRYNWDVKTLRAPQLWTNPRDAEEITAIERRATGVGISGAERPTLGFCVVGSQSGFSQPSGDLDDLNLAIDQICFGPKNPEVSRVIIARDPEVAAALRRLPYALEIKVERPQNKIDAASGSAAKEAESSQRGPPADAKGYGLADIAASVAALQPRMDQIEAVVSKIGRAIRISRWFSIVALVISMAAAVLSSLALLQFRMTDLVGESGARNPTVASVPTFSPNASGPSPAPSLKAASGHGEAQEPNAQTGSDGPDKTGASAGAKRPAEPRYDSELTGLVSSIDSLLRYKDISGNSTLKSSLEKAREEAQKQIEILKAAQPASPPLK
jgi:hypothetical protein